MAKLKISDYSSTSAGANLNTDINSIDIDEGCAPSGINNAIRTLMAQLKDFQTGVSGDSLTLGGALSGTSATFSGNVTASAISGASMTLSGDLTVDTNTLYVDSTNNAVGIGTTSPIGRFVVSNGSDNNFEVFMTSPGGASATTLQSYNRAGSVYKDTFYVANQHYFNTGTTERMRIDSSGNVGIGITSPSYKLAVSDGTVQLGISPQSTVGYAGTYSNHPYAFTTNNIERMRIDTSGRLNVGNTANYGGLISINRAQTSSVADMLTLRCGSSGNVTSFNYYGDPATGTALRFDYGGAYLSFRSSTNERMRITSSGVLLVGYTAVGNGNAGVIGAVGYNTKAGKNGALGANMFNINWTGNANLWIDTTDLGTIQFSSDYRIKRNIQTQTAPALERVMALRPVTYQRADYGDLFKASDEIKEGFIAHEVQEVIPSGVEGIKDAENQIQSLRVDAILSVAVKAIQEQQDIIKALETRIQALENA